MAIFMVRRLPSKEEEARSKRFNVHKNYLVSLSDHLLDRYGRTLETAGQGLIRDLKQQPGFTRIQRSSSADIATCKTALSLSWTGLIQLELASWSQVRFSLPYTNAWAPVHAYYAVSSAARAWLTAQGQPTCTHATTLKAIGSEVQSRRLYPPPWNVSCDGCCHDRSHSFSDDHGYAPADPNSLLSAPTLDTFWPRYLKMLETTRKNTLELRYEDWKKHEGRKQIRMPQKRKVAASVPPTTLFDFLWRLRVRSNYQGVEPYLMANATDVAQREFYEAMRLISHLSSLMFDCWLAQKIGRAEYEAAVDEFLHYSANHLNPSSSCRIDVLGWGVPLRVLTKVSNPTAAASEVIYGYSRKSRGCGSNLRTFDRPQGWITGWGSSESTPCPGRYRMHVGVELCCVHDQTDCPAHSPTRLPRVDRARL